MRVTFESITRLQYEVKKLSRLVEAFQSGEQYIRQEEGHLREIKRLERENRALKKKRSWPGKTGNWRKQGKPCTVRRTSGMMLLRSWAG
ncbi:hypothetical protein NXH76_19830 [Blautia schinkii]|nr:hypothetical protein [Blautia schinkii]